MFYTPFDTKQVEFFLFIKLKSAILIFKIGIALFVFHNLLRGGFLQCQHRTATVSLYCRMTLDYFYGQAGELFSFYRIPKALFQEPRFQNLSTDAKTLYGILLDRMSLSVKNGWLDEQNRVFII